MEPTAPARLGAPPAMETLLHRSNWILTKPVATSGRVRVVCACSTTAAGLLRLPRWRGRSRPSPLQAWRSHVVTRPSAPISSSITANTRRRGPKSTKTKSESGSSQTGLRPARTWSRTRINSEVNSQKSGFVVWSTCRSLICYLFFNHHSIIWVSEKEPPSYVSVCRKRFLCFHLLKQGVLWGLASPLPFSLWSVDDWLCNSCLTCGRASQQAASPAAGLLTWLPALEQISYLRQLKTSPSALMWTSRYHICIGNWLFFSGCVCFPYLQTTRERKHLSINYQKRNFLTI